MENQTRDAYLQFLFFLQHNVFANSRRRDDEAEYSN